MYIFVHVRDHPGSCCQVEGSVGLCEHVCMCTCERILNSLACMCVNFYLFFLHVHMYIYVYILFSTCIYVYICTCERSPRNFAEGNVGVCVCTYACVLVSVY